MAAATVAAGLVGGVTGPAFADPVTDLTGVGSPLTEDVMNAISDSIGLGVVGSYGANPVHSSIAPKRDCTMTRPHDATEGVIALRQSLGVSVSPYPGEIDVPELGCVDFARSALMPWTAHNSAGAVVFIPFALDGVSAATGTPTYVTMADTFTWSDLQFLFANGFSVTKNNITYDPRCVVSCGAVQPIHLYVPRDVNSETRYFWTSVMGVSNPLPSWVHDRAFNPATGNFDGPDVEDSDGTVLASDPYGLMPYSIAQWIAQRNGQPSRGQFDRRHGAHLHTVHYNGVTYAPLTGNFPSVETGGLNTSFLFRHEVFNAVSYDRIAGTNPDATLQSVFGPGSAICGRSSVMLSYGYGLLSSAPLGRTCGTITNDLRAY